VFCLGIRIEGGAVKDEGELVNPITDQLLFESKAPAGRVSLLFGVMSYDFARTAEHEVRFLLGIFASWIAGTVGILMTLVWTAGFLPESLHPNAASVLLAKPVPRWLFLFGKYVGVLCFVALHATIFFLGTWLAIGLRTELWYPAYLLGIPLLVFHFAVIFSVSVLFAVLFRSTTACVVGTIAFWLVCYAINYGRHFAVAYADLNPGAPALSDFTLFLSDLGYWLLPKPADFTILFEIALDLASTKVTLTTQQPFAAVLDESKSLFHPLLIIASSCLFPIFALWASASHLAKTDY
jgi:ABC-type transport system involved in multi-copper enzyme maturation permease subunit